MRRYGIPLSVLAIVLLLAATQIPAARNSFNFFIGSKNIDDFEDLDLDSQVDFGIEMSFAGNDWPVAIAVDVLGSASDEDFHDYYYGDYGIEASTGEIDVGVRKTWEFAASPIRPYIGGGLAVGWSELEFDERNFHVSDDDNGAGYWVGGGVYWKLGNVFNLGLNLRYSKVDVELFGQDFDIGGPHIGLVMGWGY